MEELTKKERKFLKRQEKEKEKQKRRQQKKAKKLLLYAAGVLIVGGGVVGLWQLSANQESTAPSKIISKQGIHWHADLSIKILGEEQKIPADIGLGINERSIHTHDSDRVIHLEFSGLVKEDDLRFGRFFEIWGKKFNKDCIFDKCSGSEGKVKIFVNDQPNYEFENYIMRDGDKIEIIFE